LPSITLGYLYTFAAIIAVSGLLVFSFMAYADALRVSSEVQELRNLMTYVAAKSSDLLTLTSVTNGTAKFTLQMPSTIGTKQYWLRLRNSSENAWLEGGLGDLPVEETELRIYLPKEASATGYYVGGYGAARLKCSLTGGVLQIQLTSSSESD
jgi:hypothetical protein